MDTTAWLRHGGVVIVVTRFRVPVDQEYAFSTQVDAAASHFRAATGVEGVDLVRNVDEPDLWCLLTRWRDVGSYRRALGGVAARMILIPLSTWAVDEPSAYADPAHVGENRPRGTVHRDPGDSR